jgi:hypothetical protein
MDEKLTDEEAPEEPKRIIKRSPAISTKISELDEGHRVSIVGTVVSRSSDISSFILDDGENKVVVLVDNQSDFEKIKEGQFIRAMGKVWGQGDEVELQADIVQDFSKIDKNLYKKVFLE